MIMTFLSTIGITKITLILVILLTTVVKLGSLDDKSFVSAILNFDLEGIHVPTAVDGYIHPQLVSIEVD